ncbi:MAG: Ni/Fe hydrogenase [Hydrogenobacter sp.]|uniref:NADH-quinone oxidoreductase subunit B family protein n=1 Tax=Hydrogenobacter thermophilus TaxID=940 RepID=UPI0030F7DCE0
MNVLWLQRLSCCGNTHSLLNCETFDSLLKEVNFLFHPSLSVGDEEEILSEVLKGAMKVNLLVIEGAVRGDDKKIRELCYIADYVMAVGSCASYGNIPALKDYRVFGLQYRFKEAGGLLGKDFISKGGLPVINVSGCPAHPEWIVGVIRSLSKGIKPELDNYGRPKEFYSSLTHWGCTRNEYFEWKIEPESLGSKKGCLFYNYGCRGPMTYSSCNIILWNGVNSKTRAGTPCFGCTEFDFPRVGLFETKQFAGLPAELPIGVSKRGYIMLSGIAKVFAPERLKIEG